MSTPATAVEATAVQEYDAIIVEGWLAFVLLYFLLSLRPLRSLR